MGQITETIRHGYGGRLKNAFGGIIVGIILVFVTIGVLWFNEKRSVDRYRDLKEGAGSVVSVGSDSVAGDNEGKLIHFSGEAVTDEVLTDEEFGISQQAIKLSRQVEMYQWVETVRREEKKNTGGSTTTTKTYSYSKEWKPNRIDSSRFNSTRYQNPSTMPFSSNTFVAEDVTVGAFTLPAFSIARISGSEAIIPTTLEGTSSKFREKGSITSTGFYWGTTPDAPEIGDVRISFSATMPGPVSVVAQQQGSTLAKFTTSRGGSLDLLERGIVPAEAMFKKAQDRNRILTWILRGVGFVLLGFGFGLILKPLSVAADVLPFLGNLVGAGVGLIGFLLGAIVWTVVVAFAWVFYRPVIGIALLLVTAAAIFLIFKVVRSRKKSSAPPPLADAPPPLT